MFVWSMGNSSLFGKVLLILHILEKFPEVKLEDTLSLKKSECDKMLKLLNQLDLVTVEENNHLLTEKGKNVLTYFYKELDLDNSPLIRI
jgi:Mn-dependent DtxR family transcriptional regulator